MKVSKNFSAEEFLSPEYLEVFGTDAIKFVNHGLIKAAQYLRDYYDCPVIINDHEQFIYSGLRPFNCQIGALYSAHKFGLAIDVKAQGVPSWQVQKDVMQTFQSIMFGFGIRRMELDTNGWTHLDCLYTGLDYIKGFSG